MDSVSGQWRIEEAFEYSQTLVDFHICNSLPLVHGNKPCVISLSSAAQVDDQLVLVSSKRLEYRIKTLLAESTFWEQEGSDDDLNFTRVNHRLTSHGSESPYFLSTGIHPNFCVLIIDASSHLETPWPRL